MIWLISSNTFTNCVYFLITRHTHQRLILLLSHFDEQRNHVRRYTIIACCYVCCCCSHRRLSCLLFLKSSLALSRLLLRSFISPIFRCRCLFVYFKNFFLDNFLDFSDTLWLLPLFFKLVDYKCVVYNFAPMSNSMQIISLSIVVVPGRNFCIACPRYLLFWLLWRFEPYHRPGELQW